MYSELGIKICFSSPIQPQENVKVKATNKVIKHHLKTKLSNHNGVGADKLLNILWAYRITLYSAISETPYFLAFRVEAIVLVKIGLFNYRIAHFS